MTLVEMVVALAIVAVMTSVAVLSLGGADRSSGAQNEAVRLAARLGLAVDMALVDSGGVQLEWDERGYGLTHEQDGDPALGGRHDLGAGLRLAGPSPTGKVMLSETMLPAAAAFVIHGRGAAWRVDFDGVNASASPVSPP